MPLRRLFALTSVAFLIVLAISPAKNALRPYRAFQRQVRRARRRPRPQRAAGEGVRAAPIAIQQIWLPDLDNRVDRCTTCHLGRRRSRA